MQTIIKNIVNVMVTAMNAGGNAWAVGNDDRKRFYSGFEEDLT